MDKISKLYSVLDGDMHYGEKLVRKRRQEVKKRMGGGLQFKYNSQRYLITLIHTNKKNTSQVLKNVGLRIQFLFTLLQERSTGVLVPL